MSMFIKTLSLSVLMISSSYFAHALNPDSSVNQEQTSQTVAIKENTAAIKSQDSKMNEYMSVIKNHTEALKNHAQLLKEHIQALKIKAESKK
jgi:hypothetical protein